MPKRQVKPEKRRAFSLTPDLRQHKAETTRRCIVSGECLDRSDLIRFVLSPDEVVTPDFSQALPGRGAWVRADAEAVQKAARSELFRRAFRSDAKVPEGLCDQVEAGLKKAALNALGLARRSGVMVLGFEKLKSELQARKVEALIIASDASPAVSSKLTRHATGVFVVNWLSEAELSSALGRDRVVYAALKSGPNFGLAKAALEKLRRFRPPSEK